MNEPWEDEADFYRRLLITSCDEVHFGVGIPGNRELGLINRASPGQSALDLGCGSGENLLALSRLGYRVTGVEPSARQLEYAGGLLAEHDVEATLLQLPAQRVGEIRSIFDVVLSVGALHFCSDIAQVFQAVVSVLRTGGKFFLSMPHPIDMLSNYEVIDDTLVVKMSSYFPSGQLVRGARYWTKFGGSQPTGYQFDEYIYTVGGLVEALVDAGFRIRALLEPECRHEAGYPCLFRSPDAAFLKRYCASVPQYIVLVAEMNLSANDVGDDCES